MLGIQTRKAVLLFCSKCQGAFFSGRYTSSEMLRLYNDYRGEEYVTTRKKWEPWYSSAYNKSHLNSEYSIKRKSILKEFLSYCQVVELKSIVDVGGNLGEFIPEVQGVEKRYVLDISVRELPTGIMRIQDLTDVGSVDLVIYAHVLEHVSNPFDELEKLMQSCKYLYVEVPNGVPAPNMLRRHQVFQPLLVFLSLSTITWGYFSRPSAGRKVAASILRQSEHLSFFCEQTLKVIAEKQGINVTTRVTQIITPDMQEATVIQGLFSHE